MAFTFITTGSTAFDATSTSSSVDVGTATNKVLIVGLHGDGDGFPTSVTYAGNAMTSGGTFTGGVFDMAIYYAINPTNGSNTLAASWSAGQDRGMMWQAWSADGTITFDKVADGANGAVTVSLTTAEASELIAGFFADQEATANARTPGTGVTERIDAIAGSGAGDYGQFSGSRIGGAAGSHTINYTPDPGDADGGAIAFIEAAAEAEIIPQDSGLSLAIDATSITQNHVVASQDASISLSMDNATIAQNHVITTQDMALSITEDNTTIAESYLLAAQDIAVGASLDTTTISQNHVLTSADLSLGLTEDAATIAQNHVIASNDLVSSLGIDATTLAIIYGIDPFDLSIFLSTDEATLVQNHPLTVQGISIGSLLDTTTIAENKVVSPDDIGISTSLGVTTIVRTLPPTAWARSAINTTAWEGTGSLIGTEWTKQTNQSTRWAFTAEQLNPSADCLWDDAGGTYDDTGETWDCIFAQGGSDNPLDTAWARTEPQTTDWTKD